MKRRSTYLELPPMQLAVTRLACDGVSATEIAKRLEISVYTVHNHLRAVYRKLGVHNRVELVRAFCKVTS